MINIAGFILHGSMVKKCPTINVVVSGVKVAKMIVQFTEFVVKHSLFVFSLRS